MQEPDSIAMRLTGPDLWGEYPDRDGGWAKDVSFEDQVGALAEMRQEGSPPPAVMPIPATTSLGHLRDNLAAEDLELTSEELRTIDGLAPDHAH